MGSICSALAKEDPAAAMAWLSEKQAAEKAGSKRDEILINTFSEWTTAEPQAAAAWAGSLPVGEMRKTVQNALATSLFRTGQCDEAARILSSLGSDANRFAIWGMARAWVGKDPQAAADWAATQPPGGLQAESLSAVVSSWALDNPRGVQDWLAQFPAGEVRDKCINAFLGRMDMQADRSLKQAEFDTWFERVEDPWRRTKLAVWNYRTMKQHDPIAARAWLSALPNVDADLVRMTLYE